MRANFTLKQLLGMMVLFSIVAVCLASAYRGSIVAYGLLWGAVLFVIPLLFLAGIYWFAWSIFWLIERRTPTIQDRANPSFAVKSSNTQNISESKNESPRDDK